MAESPEPASEDKWSGKKIMKKKFADPNADALAGAERTIFNSPQSLDSDERDAVKKGENRGKKAAIADRPEHYGNIGSINSRQYAKNRAEIDGECKGCEHWVKSDRPGGHCTLPKTKNCIR